MTHGRAPLLVTGGAGWLGSALVERLAAAGERVRCLEHLRPAPASARERLRGDLRDPGVAARAVDGCRAVLHLAGLTHGHGVADYRALNVEASATLAGAASRAGVERFVHLSSRTAVPGAGAYGESKLAGERRVQEAFPDAVVLRPAEVYGAGSRDMVQRLIARVARSPVLPCPRLDGGRIAPIYLDDFLGATVNAATAPAVPAGVYVLAGPEEMPLRQLLERSARALGRRLFLLPLPDFALRAVVAARLGGLTADRLAAFRASKPAEIGPARRELDLDPRPLEAGVRAWAAAHGSR
jgi:NADH dehydrogenase